MYWLPNGQFMSSAWLKLVCLHRKSRKKIKRKKIPFVEHDFRLFLLLFFISLWMSDGSAFHYRAENINKMTYSDCGKRVLRRQHNSNRTSTRPTTTNTHNALIQMYIRCHIHRPAYNTNTASKHRHTREAIIDTFLHSIPCPVFPCCWCRWCILSHGN